MIGISVPSPIGKSLGPLPFSMGVRPEPIWRDVIIEGVDMETGRVINIQGVIKIL